MSVVKPRHRLLLPLDLSGAGAFLVAQRPSFWIEFGVRLGQALIPRALRYFTRRMPSEEEAAWRAAEKRGGGMSG